MLIKNVLPHPDDLHDGRPFPSYETAEITDEEFEVEHYQARLRDGLLVVCDSEPESVSDIEATIAAASDDEREDIKARYRTAEEARPRPRKGVIDATKPKESN